MRDCDGPRTGTARHFVRVAAWMLLAIGAWPLPAGADPARSAAAMTNQAVMPHIEAVLTDPAVVDAIHAWGLSPADVRHDIAALTPIERVRLAYVLTRRWHATDSHAESDLQAQYLVMLSLMRESTLFASIISTGPSRLR